MNAALWPTTSDALPIKRSKKRPHIDKNKDNATHCEKKAKDWHDEVWNNVRLSKVSTSDGTIKRAKGLYIATIAASGRSTIVLRRATDEGKDRTIAIQKLPQLTDKRIYLDDGFLLDFSSHSDALACLSLISKALHIPCKNLEGTTSTTPASLDLNDPCVQGYIATLLIDPSFEAFVSELASFYTKVRSALPSNSPFFSPSKSQQRPQQRKGEPTSAFRLRPLAIQNDSSLYHDAAS